MKEIKVLELFSGYGGASFALKKANIQHSVIGFSDINKVANKCYKNNHRGKELNDITKINPNDLEDFNLLTGGFPCQSFSIAGKREGFQSQKTGNLFFEIIRIAQIKKPKYMLLENVKGILNHDNGRTHKKVLYELKQIGYDVIWDCLNSNDYNIPQNRERVWYVCKLGSWAFLEFQFPSKEKLNIELKDILEKNVSNKYYINDETIKKIQNRNRFGDHLLTKDTKIHPCLCAIGKSDVGIIKVADFRSDEGIRIRKNNCTPTLTTSNKILLNKHNKWRYLTPKECFRLMGFLHDEINLIDISESNQYKLAGNGWDINIASKILKNMLK